jgi:hypothetical protein
MSKASTALAGRVVDQPPAVVSDSTQLIQAIARAASDPTVDVEKMRQLFDMHTEMKAAQAKELYATQMARCQKKMPVISKNAYNSQTNSKYANLERINKVITPIYTSFGFSLSFGEDTSPYEKHIRVVCDCLHEGGHSIRYTYDNPIDDAGIQGAKNKTPTHGKSSAVSYARRYITVMIFNLTIQGEDDDGNSSTRLKKQPARKKEPAAGKPPTTTQSDAEIAERKDKHDLALVEHKQSVAFIKERIAADDMKAVATEWSALGREAQLALFLSPALGGCFTIEERKAIHALLFTAKPPEDAE